MIIHLLVNVLSLIARRYQSQYSNTLILISLVSVEGGIIKLYNAVYQFGAAYGVMVSTLFQSVTDLQVNNHGEVFLKPGTSCLYKICELCTTS